MKKFFAALLAFVLFTSLFAFLPPSAAAAETRYLVINDELVAPPGGVPPTVTDELVYAPLDLFTQYFGFTYSYDSFSNALTVTSGQKNIYFNRRIGLAMDDSKIYYSYTFYFSGSTFMVPCQFLCNFFGLRYSYIPNGPIVRVSGAGAALTDAQVFAKYESIFVTQTPVAPEQNYNRSVYLTFDGAPGENTAAILDSLSRYGATATFFLTAEGIREYPELVFRMIAEGHAVGLNGPAATASPEAYLAAVDEANNLLYRTAKIKTRLLRHTPGSRPSLTTSYREALTRAGYRIWDYNVNAAYTRNVSAATIYANLATSLANRQTHALVRLVPDRATSQVMGQILSYLNRNQFSFLTISDLQTPQNQWNDTR